MIRRPWWPIPYVAWRWRIRTCCAVQTGPGLGGQGRRAGRGQGRRWSPAAAPDTNRCTAASSAPACWTPPARARCSPRRRRTQVAAAVTAVDGGAGVLLIVKNYTGDVLNFETAAELARPRENRRAHRGDRRRRRRARTPPTPRAGAASAAPCCWRRSSARPPSRAPTWTRCEALATQGGGQRALAGPRADRADRAARRQAELRAGRRRDGARHRHPRRTRPRAA